MEELQSSHRKLDAALAFFVALTNFWGALTHFLVYCLPPGCRSQAILGDLRAGLVFLGCIPATAAVADTHMGGAHRFVWEIQR